MSATPDQPNPGATAPDNAEQVDLIVEYLDETYIRRIWDGRRMFPDDTPEIRAARRVKAEAEARAIVRGVLKWCSERIL